ncbi:hypothetical protein ACONUD_14470 [Microbulbifer harenosus]|uniref:Uncharacterized protein n=1 Tax=Microbulbifer harenosus TaxID=2576840 RepID=A0ABY2ULS6_9GAMM|nr:hypothetical protein [Microbulbifer harenosus]TLM79158.1 hypothetical protein FDY93_03360 [Microbulbifer harenosus]
MAKPKLMTREELYELVWTKPVSNLAAEFNLSDKGLNKKCLRHNIPCPPVGYWAKVQNGHKVKRTPLPRNTNPELETVMFWPKSDTVIAVKAPASHLTEEQFEKALAYTIPEQVNRYHSVVAACRKAYKESGKRRNIDNYGRVTFPRLTANPGFKVTPETFDRACLFLQGMITLFGSIGWSFVERYASRSDTAASWGFKHGNEILSFEIKELVTKMSVSERNSQTETGKRTSRRNEPDFSFLSYSPPYYKSTGKIEFAIELYSPGFKVRWKDNGTELIEHQLSTITQGFSRAFEYSRLRTIENEKRRLEYEKQEAVRKEQARLQRIEKECRERLFSLADTFDKVTKLKHLITAFETKGCDDPRLVEWLSWAREVANDLDPLAEPRRILDIHEAIGDKEIFY